MRTARSGVLVLGAGFAGSEVVRRLGRGGASVVSTRDDLLFTPLVPETLSGTTSPQDLGVPLAALLPHADRLRATVDHVDLTARLVTLSAPHATVELRYDALVLALGSVPALGAVPGAARHAFPAATDADTARLRAHVLAQLAGRRGDRTDPAAAARHTVVVAGGGYTGVETLAELRRLVAGSRGGLTGTRWVLVEAGERLLPELAPGLGAWLGGRLVADGVELRTGVGLARVDTDGAVLTDGERIPAATVVWSAGTQPAGDAAGWGLPVDETGRVVVDGTLAVPGLPGVWALGDGAAVPNAATGGQDPGTAQHALRQARRLAWNLTAVRRGDAAVRYRYAELGQVAALGRGRGVADVLGVRLRGLPGWVTARGTHLALTPGWDRRRRILAGWAERELTDTVSGAAGLIARPGAALPDWRPPGWPRRPSDGPSRAA